MLHEGHLESYGVPSQYGLQARSSVCERLLYRLNARSQTDDDGSEMSLRSLKRHATVPVSHVSEEGTQVVGFLDMLETFLYLNQ